MSAKKRIGVVIATTGATLALAGLFAGSASALAYDGQDPEASGCASTAITAEQADISYNGVTVGVVQLRYSTACRTVWSRVEAYTSRWAVGTAGVIRNSPASYEGWGNETPVPWSSSDGAYTAWTPMLDDADMTSFAHACLDVTPEQLTCNNTASY